MTAVALWRALRRTLRHGRPALHRLPGTLGPARPAIAATRGARGCGRPALDPAPGTLGRGRRTLAPAPGTLGLIPEPEKSAAIPQPVNDLRRRSFLVAPDLMG